MDRFDARRPGALIHGGTFNGNPVAAAAGLATLRHLTPDRYDRLRASASGSGTGLADAIRGRRPRRPRRRCRLALPGLPGADAPGRRQLAATETLFLGLLLDGFHLAPRGMGAISTPATEADVDDLAAAVVRRLAAMQPAAVSVR